MKRLVSAFVALLFFLPIRYSHAQEKVRVGYGAVSIQSGLIWIAKQRGLFAKYALSPEIVYIPGGSTNIQ
ncbi:MAG: hypothetical protein AAB070_04745, partial [Candidatus Binatota bacterium]